MNRIVLLLILAILLPRFSNAQGDPCLEIYQQFFRRLKMGAYLADRGSLNLNSLNQDMAAIYKSYYDCVIEKYDATEQNAEIIKINLETMNHAIDFINTRNDIGKISPRRKSVLETAKGINVTYAELDCVEFVSKALQSAGYEVRGKKGVVQRYIHINFSHDLNTLIQRNHPMIMGVVFAMQMSGQGTPVPISELRPGDIVQYWNSQNVGHAGIVSEVISGRRIKLFGSHRQTDGTGLLTLTLPTNSYAVRPRR